MEEAKRILGVLAAVAIFGALVACGGGSSGSGGDDGGDTFGGVTFSGNSSVAVITEENATEVALSAFSGGGMATPDLIFLSAAVGNAEVEQQHMQFLLDFTKRLRKTAPILANEEDPAVRLQNYYDYMPRNGQCGGTYDWSGTPDPEAASGSVTFNFNNYCDFGTTISGKIRVVWSHSSGTVYFEPLHAVIGGSASFTYGGQYRWTETESSTSWTDVLTLNLVLIDVTNDRSYKFENLRIEETIPFDFNAPDRMVMSGRFFDFEHGRVTISTPQVVLLPPPYNWPSEGTIQFDGDNSSVRMIFISGGARIEWRQGASGNWQLKETISSSEFPVWF